MSKRKNKVDFAKIKENIAQKRLRKDDNSNGTIMEYITVQRLSSHVEGKYQKYSRIGALTSVPLNCEPTIENIKQACKRHFNVPEGISCDILAGERGPSWKETSQITNLKLVHVRFIEINDDVENSEKVEVEVCTVKSQEVSKKVKPAMTTKVAASVPLSAMLLLGKLIEPTVDVVTIHLEEFKIAEKSWSQPFEATFSMERKPFASGGFRNAHLASPLSGMKPGKYVIKKFKADQVNDIERLFKSIEEHTRKSVQMNALARNFTIMLAKDKPQEYGPHLCYTKVYFGKLREECITVESFLDGEFQKHINNTGEISSETKTDLTLKAESFTHYTYEKSNKELMVLDIQGIGHQLIDPEIATSSLMDPDHTHIYFCCGNLSVTAIDKFLEVHTCNRFCAMLGLSPIKL